MMRSLTRSLARAERSSEVWPLIVWTGAASPGSVPGCDRGSIRPDPPVLDQQHLVAVDGDGFAFPDDQRPCLRRSRLAVAKQPEVAQEGPGVAQRQLQGVLAAGRQRRPAVSGSAAGTPSIPRQLRTAGAGSSLPKATSRVSPRLNRSSGPCSDQIGVAGASGRRARLSAFACSASAGRAWARPAAGHIGASAAAPNPAISVASIQREFGACHRTDADHFLLYLS